MIQFQETVTYSCLSNLALIGDAVQSCLENGSLSSVAPHCICELNLVCCVELWSYRSLCPYRRTQISKWSESVSQNHHDRCDFGLPTGIFRIIVDIAVALQWTLYCPRYTQKTQRMFTELSQIRVSCSMQSSDDYYMFSGTCPIYSISWW